MTTTTINDTTGLEQVVIFTTLDQYPVELIAAEVPSVIANLIAGGNPNWEISNYDAELLKLEIVAGLSPYAQAFEVIEPGTEFDGRFNLTFYGETITSNSDPVGQQ